MNRQQNDPRGASAPAAQRLAPGPPPSPAPAPVIVRGGSSLHLLAERAVFVPEHSTLLVADAHIGKAATFRRLGVPVPGGTTEGTLARLTQALARTGARQVVFLGDLLHSAHAHASTTMAAFERWRQTHANIELVLILGNHDQKTGVVASKFGVRVEQEDWRLGDLALRHHPLPEAGAGAVPLAAGVYALAGHVHPAVLVGAGRRERLRLPCFHFGAQRGVLPAFGEFTGMHVVRSAPGERVFAVVEDEVREV
jgi:uncharacterized protein